ncbi:endonuclease Q family protein [archaeon]|nr:endonuclease Q family protein [archaeon]
MLIDLHIHGPHSRGTSKQLSITNLEKYARIKGIDLLGTGDFTHPVWLAHLREHLEERGGLLYTKTGFPFMLSTEISSIYSQDGKTRKIHQVLLAPNFDIVEQIREALLKHGRLDYDGRPIFGLPAPEIVELAMEASKDCFVFPAHIWTPWFSLFGSNSGFDSMKDCYQDMLKHVHAIETGMSSDPAMNWRLSQLDDKAILSFSDAHSHWPWRIGREATSINTKPSYTSIIQAFKYKNIEYTVETNPSYGKYHFDGHRNCGISFSPREALAHNNTCPVCKRPLTIGVMHRVEVLADREEEYQPKNATPFKTLIPLSEIISAVTGKGIATAFVWKEYNELVQGSSELQVMLKMNELELRKRSRPAIAEAILKNREGKIQIEPGFDGVYGKPIIETKIIKKGQKTLSDF